MLRRYLICGIACLLMIVCCYNTGIIFAQQEAENKITKSSITSIPHKQKIYGIVGEVEYVDFKKKGKSVVSVKNKKGETAEVFLKDLQDGATVLVTYRKVKDSKGNEQNTLISMSVIKGIDDKQKE
ncbi:MAG: hypothetical protein GY853_11350 [PVC group bacterium]|nr:hypothetical protein [PVC group bacterium]